MGLSNFPSAGDGLLPAVVVDTVFWVELLKGLLQSWIQIASVSVASLESAQRGGGCGGGVPGVMDLMVRCTAQLKTLCCILGGECCVCLCGFGEDEEITELSCRHWFHRGCLEKWFGNGQRTCPLCRRSVPV